MSKQWSPTSKKYILCKNCQTGLMDRLSKTIIQNLNNKHMDYSELFPPKNPMVPSTFLFATRFIEESGGCTIIETEEDLGTDISEMPIEKRMHSMRVYKLMDRDIFRVHIKYRLRIPHVMELVKDPEEGWVLEQLYLSSETIRQIGKIIDKHLSN